MSNVNITEVCLLSTPLEKDYKHTLYFANPSDQQTYMQSKVIYRFDDFSYIAKDKRLRVPKYFEELLKCNYVMYRNSLEPKKWFYGFITDIQWVSEGTSNVIFEIDHMQTWMFDYTVKPSFVEREHTLDDTIGANTVPEGLETGEYVCNSYALNEDLISTSIIMGVTLDINDYTNQPNDWNNTKEFKPAHGELYDGIYSGLKYFAIGSESLKTVLKHLAYEGQDSSVHCLFMAPTKMLRLGTGTNYQFGKPVLSNVDPVYKLWSPGDKPSKLNGYTPKNNKLLTYPYCYMMVDNGGGGGVAYHFEKFTTNVPFFEIRSCITPGMSIRAVPRSYNGVVANDAEGLNLSKYATCSWNTDAYTSWLSQNAINIGLNVGGGVASTALGVAGAVSGAATGGAGLAVAGAIVGGVAAIGGQLGSVAEHAMVPPQLEGNINGGDIATASGCVTFHAYTMTIKKEYAQIIDDYFSAFGYKTNRVKVPNTNHRKNYWYTKTIDANIDVKNGCGIPQDAMEAIKTVYNNGVTFWRNNGNYGDYSVDNSIIKG